jgi:hypothetical protein
MARNEPILSLVPADYARASAHEEFGGGYGLRHAERDFDVAWRFLDVHHHGACVVRVGGTEEPATLQLAAFAPGRPVLLRPETDDEHGPDAVGVWDALGTVRVGHIARQNLYDARRLLFTGEPVQAIVLWDWRTDSGLRTGVNLLIARAGVVKDLDAPARRFERPPARRTFRTGPALAVAAVVWLVLASLFGLAGAVIGGVVATLAIIGTLER